LIAARVLTPLAGLLPALPLVWLAWAVAGELATPGSRLGADPGEAVTQYLGEWGLRLLLLTLAISPLHRRLHWRGAIRWRRILGLFAFGYLLLHALAYAGLLAEFDLDLVIDDLVRRPYITVGALALLLLTPLAVTSTRAWQRRLGRDWRRLHRLVYAAAVLGLLHLFWLTRDGYGEWLLYLLIFMLLMVERRWQGSKT
jgi:sulfoxide reductase heme-binding subunit YedZ